jgi:uncharacterized membrane protein
VPFLAVLQGRQQLKWQEFLRPAYAGILIFVLGFWWVHPHLIQAAQTLPW